MSRRRLVDLARHALPAAALVGVAVWEAAAARRDADDVPDDRAWAAAAAAVRGDYRPGDLLVFAPRWVDPVGRLHLGDLISLADAGRIDAARYARVFELAIRGARAPEVAGERPSSTRDFDGVEVRRYDRIPPTIVTDLRDVAAGVQLDGGHARSPAVSLEEVGFEPHRCILAVPNAETPLRITFPQVALGTSLAGGAGIADVFTRRDVRDPGRLQVAIDDVVVIDRALGVDDGWVPLAAPTVPHVADVTVIVSSPAANRQICFALEARRP